MATDELAKKLERRVNINEGVEEGTVSPQSNVFNPYTEFKEFSRKQIKEFEKMFKKYDVNNDKHIDLPELKLMMEKLEAPQTHVGLKEMIREVDEDHDGAISYREFLLIFRKAAAGELVSSGFENIYKNVTEIEVDKTGVSGAKDFFMSKSNPDVLSLVLTRGTRISVGVSLGKTRQIRNIIQITAQTQDKKFEDEIKEEQEQRKKEAEEKKVRKAAFKEKANMFNAMDS